MKEIGFTLLTSHLSAVVDGDRRNETNHTGSLAHLNITSAPNSHATDKSTFSSDSDMIKISIEDKKNQILDYEKSTASRLARRVIEKPDPSVWMIFMPIFFVFHAWKIKQYSNGLKYFVGNYLISRRRALDTAFEAEQSGVPPDIDQLVEKVDNIPAKVQPFYHNWMTLLVNHYRGLLAAPGDSQQDLKRALYRNKSSYLLFCNQLNKAENAFNIALLPGLEGDQQDLRYILDKIDQGITDLRRKEVNEIFS